MRSARNLAKHELIGLSVRIESSSDPSLVGVEGRIVDETKNMFVIDTGNKEIKAAKKTVKLRFDDYGILLDGKKIKYRPEDRIKKVR